VSYCKSLDGKSLAYAGLLACIAFLSQPAHAEAGFIGGFVGNTLMTNGTTSGIVDFAVYQNDGTMGGNWTLQLGISGVATDGFGSGIDTTAQYVYFYEVVNVGSTKYGDLFVNSYSNPYSSGGWLLGKVFNEAVDGAVGPATNRYLGTIPTGPDSSGIHPSANDGVLSTPLTSSFISDGSTVRPLAINTLGGGGVPADFAWVNFPLAGTTQLSPAQYSPVLFLTSNTAPTYASGGLQSTSGTASAGIPSEAPEPGTLAIWGLGLATFGIVSARRRSRTGA
jgi:PEP-CTERM motif-containing protein